MNYASEPDENDREAPWYWRQSDLFDGIDVETRKQFYARSTVREFSRGDNVFLADDVADKVFYLIDGMIKIEHIAPNGHATIFWLCVPGALFGAGGITGSLRQSVYAKALEPSRMLILRRQRFEELILAYPALALNVIKLLGGRLRLACDSMAEVNQRASLRVGRAILRLAENCGQWTPRHEVVLRARISHQEIADMIGCTRQTVTEVLQGLSKLEILRIEKRVIYICDVKRLRHCVEEAENHNAMSLFPD